MVHAKRQVLYLHNSRVELNSPQAIARQLIPPQDGLITYSQAFCRLVVYLTDTVSLSSTCKARHVRCDEKKPVCSTCERLGLECRPGEIIAYSEWCPPKKDKPRRRGSVAIANNDVSSQGPPTSTWDIFSSNLPELNCNSTSGSSEPSPESLNLLPLSPTTGVGTASPPTTPAVVLTAETVYLLREFQNGLAKWMDVFDHESTYQREVCRRALTFQLLLTCICAFTARQLCLIGSGETWTPVATKYYSQSLNLLIKQINNPDRRDDILTAVMLLSSYEILAAEGEEYRQHCEGAMKLIRTHGINAQSTGLDRASFWIWTRHELTVAIANEMPLQMAPKHWNVKWREGETGEDMLGNQILWLVGRAVDWVYGNGTPSEYSDLLRDTERWYAALPPSFCGVKYGEPIEDELSKVHFAVPAAGKFPVFFPTTLLLRNKPFRLMEILPITEVFGCCKQFELCPFSSKNYARNVPGID